MHVHFITRGSFKERKREYFRMHVQGLWYTVSNAKKLLRFMDTQNLIGTFSYADSKNIISYDAAQSKNDFPASCKSKKFKHTVLHVHSSVNLISKCQEFFHSIYLSHIISNSVNQHAIFIL